MLEWLMRLLTASFDVMGSTCGLAWCMYSVPVQSKSDKHDCNNSSGISLLSVVGKLYRRVLNKRVRIETACAIGEKQCGFRQGRECLDQVFGPCV